MLVYLFLNKVATLTQSNSLYFRMCISVSQLVRSIGIAVFAGMALFSGMTVFAGTAVFARFRCLTVITSNAR